MFLLGGSNGLVTVYENVVIGDFNRIVSRFFFFFLSFHVYVLTGCVSFQVLQVKN